jgi:hypothetical protein
MAVRNTSTHFAGPALMARMSVTFGPDLASRRRTAASREISSKGLRECLTPTVSIAVWDLLTRGLICGEGC